MCSWIEKYPIHPPRKGTQYCLYIYIYIYLYFFYGVTQQYFPMITTFIPQLILRSTPIQSLYITQTLSNMLNFLKFL